jgi:hypothetical protein
MNNRTELCHAKPDQNPKYQRNTVLSRRNGMKSTQKLHEIGQSLWLDNITRVLLASGTLQRYIQELSSITPSRTVTTMTARSARN